jgi:hypothetical protein
MPRNDNPPVQLPPEIETTDFRIAPPAGIGNGAVAVSSTTVTSMDINNPGKTLSTEVHVCADCNRVMHKPEQVGGVCAVCNRLLCVESARLLCELFGRCACLEHSADTGKGRVCRNHGWVQTLIHMFSSKHNPNGGQK